MTTFTGDRRLGPKIAKFWNRTVRKLSAPCPACGVDCGGNDELQNHLKKRHPKWVRETEQAAGEAQ